jgi:hypothetical protein
MQAGVSLGPMRERQREARTHRRVPVQVSQDRIQRERNISEVLGRVDRDRLPVLGYSRDPTTSYFPRLDSSSGLPRWYGSSMRK